MDMALNLYRYFVMVLLSYYHAQAAEGTDTLTKIAKLHSTSLRPRAVGPVPIDDSSSGEDDKTTGRLARGN